MIYPETFESKVGFDFVRQHLLKLCNLEQGRKMVSAMAFSSDFESVKNRLEATSEMLALIESRHEPPMGGVADVDALLQQLSVPGALLSAQELLSLSRTLSAFAEISDFFAKTTVGDSSITTVRLAEIAVPLHAFPELTSTINSAVDRFGAVRDNASSELADIRRSMISVAGSVNSAMRRIIAKAVSDGIIESDVTPTMRDGRLVLPVAPMNKRRISGIVHDESATGKTVFIEPAEVVSANNRIRELELEERREVARILLAVADLLRPSVPEMRLCMDVAGELDFIRAKALFAEEFGGCLPTLHPSPELEWYHACHPGLISSLQRQNRQVVPLDIELSTPERRILVISGPNAGGKSVCLKTVGLLQYMVQCGMLPCVYENSRFGIFRDIFVDIGDDQSLDDDLSTYSSHLRNMRFFVDHGGDRSLMLIDEFGGGTEPQIGGALAQAILKRMNNSGMYGVVTTHYQNLKLFAEETVGIVNGSMLYDRHLMQPMFKLSVGNPGSSFALEIARKIGLPADIIAEAQSIVGSDYVNMDKYLLDIARDKRYWENKRRDIRLKERKLDSTIERFEADTEKLRQSRNEIIHDAREQAKNILHDANALVERTVAEIRTANAERQRTLAAREALKVEGSEITSRRDREHKLLRNEIISYRRKKTIPTAPSQSQSVITIGSFVKLDGEGSVGKVLSIDSDKAIVAFGGLKMTVPLKRLVLSNQKPTALSANSTFIKGSDGDSRRRQLNFGRQLDIRGMRHDEAVQAVMYYIDDAIQFAADRVRILHGTGTGALREAIRKYLATIPDVKSFHDEDVRFGGAGITVVNL